MKVCSNKKCPNKGEPQPESNFNRRPLAHDGLNPRCKDCRKQEYEKQKSKKGFFTHSKNMFIG